VARWWRLKRDPSTDLGDWQKRTLRAVEEGHSAILDFSTFLAVVTTDGRSAALRRLAGLRRVVSGIRVGRREVELPTWVSDLPQLRQIDTRGNFLTSLPQHRQVRWGVDVDTLAAVDIHPSRVYAVGIDDASTSPALDQLLHVAASSRMQLSELSVTSNRPHLPQESPPRVATWASGEWIAENLDQLLSRQPSLAQLTLSGYPFGQLPSSISSLDQLIQLSVTDTWPRTLPDWLFTRPKLAHLTLANNGLTVLPESTGAATKLRILNLSANQFPYIPTGIWDLSALRVLDLTDNPIREVPRDILRLEQLVRFSIRPMWSRENADRRIPKELVVPPPEVAQQGLEAIKSYWRQEEEVGVDYLAEAKLLIIGEAGAGKTSLSKKILDPAYRLNAWEDSTEGIDVRPWTFASAIRVRDHEGERLLEREMRVNVWDFGGQEIYHSTHQFFLTKRSVYVLVCDERKEDTDFQYWLDVINLLSGGSPLIIVQNRKQGRAQALDEAGLRRAYPRLCGIISLNLADNSGLDEAVTKIRKEVESLPHIGTSLPKTWRDVRVALEGDPRDHITADEFFRICRANGFTRDDDIRQLGGFLHDLGICLYFQDDDLLRKTVILKPEWGTGAVYRALDDSQVIESLGVFGRDDLPRIWHERTYAGMHAELVQLMVKFALCFPVEGEPKKYVAPQLLSPAQPEYEWDDNDDLVLRYEYDVMPKGIVRRLIVGLHDLIEGPLVWRTGVVLGHETGRAEIIEEYHRRRLRIRLLGTDPRVLLAIIDRELALIHRSYPEIKFGKLRPCDCPVCATSSEPAMFLISELEDFARTGDPIQCRLSRKLLDPVPLLAELSSDVVWRPDPLPLDRPAAPPVRRPEVFVSYKWGGAAESLVDQLQARLETPDVDVVRDKTEMSYRDSIRDFMRRLGEGKAVVVVLDKAYLESANCMFELTQIAARTEFRSRVFPIVMADAGIFQPVDRLGYIAFWERKKAELEEAMRAVGQENLHGIREELDLYETIRNTISGLMTVLGDMNTLTPEMHRDGDFEQLYQAITERLKQR